jgi:hypothetical protein
LGIDTTRSVVGEEVGTHYIHMTTFVRSEEAVHSIHQQAIVTTAGWDIHSAVEALVAAAAVIQDILRTFVAGSVEATSPGAASLDTRVLPREPRGHTVTFPWVEFGREEEEEAKLLALKTPDDVKEQGQGRLTTEMPERD